MNCYCTQCGKLLQYPYRFCSNCGARNNDPPAKIQEYGFENQDREQVKLKRVKRYYIISSFVTLLGVFVCLFTVGFIVSFLVELIDSFFPFLVLLIGLVGVIWLMIVPSIVMLVKMQKQHTQVKEDIMSKKNPFEDEDESDKIIYDYEETLPYPEQSLYDACIRASILRFQYPCCGMPYRKIYAGWACIARDRRIAKLYIYLTPVPNGTRLRLHFAYLNQISVFRKKKMYTNTWNDILYARGFVDLIKHQVRLPVQ